MNTEDKIELEILTTFTDDDSDNLYYLASNDVTKPEAEALKALLSAYMKLNVNNLNNLIESMDEESGLYDYFHELIQTRLKWESLRKERES